MTCKLWQWIFKIGIGFLLLAGLLFCIGFSTAHWSVDGKSKFGLWEQCLGATCSPLVTDLPDYLVAAQAFQTMTLIMYTVSPFLHLLIYLLVNRVICKYLYKAKSIGDEVKDKCENKANQVIRSRIFEMGYSIGAIFHLCSILIFRLEVPHPEYLSWSFSMSAASVGLSLAGIFLMSASRNSALKKFKLLSSKHRGRHTGRVGSVPNRSVNGESSGSAPQSTNPTGTDHRFSGDFPNSSNTGTATYGNSTDDRSHRRAQDELVAHSVHDSNLHETASTVPASVERPPSYEHSVLIV